MKKTFQRLTTLLCFLLFTFVPLTVVHAQQFSLLPATELSYDDCKKKMTEYEKAADPTTLLTPDKRSETLGCAIKTGRITFNMIPFFVTYLSNFLLGMSGIICVLFIVIGGYHYVIGGLTEEKEKGKQTIFHALTGMGVALLAWTIVTVLIGAVTG